MPSSKTPTKQINPLSSSGYNPLASVHVTGTNNQLTVKDLDTSYGGQSLEGGSNSGMKVCRGPFNVNCTTAREPQAVLLEMVKALELNRV